MVGGADATVFASRAIALRHALNVRREFLKKWRDRGSRVETQLLFDTSADDRLGSATYKAIPRSSGFVYETKLLRRSSEVAAFTKIADASPEDELRPLITIVLFHSRSWAAISPTVRKTAC